MLPLILLLSTGLPAHAATTLAAECYDLNSTKSCLELSKKLAASKSASDRERSKLARQRACTLGEQWACASASASASASAPAPASASVPASGPSQDSVTLKRGEVETELSNLPALLQAARLEAREQGYEFTQIEPKSPYEKLGFRVGDILLEINGHTVEDSAQAMELFMLLRSETHFKVKLKRGGVTLLRRYEIRE